MRPVLIGLSLLVLLSNGMVAWTASAQTALDDIHKIQKAGALVCGIDQNEAEFSTTDDHGSVVEFDKDLCKAFAIAILGQNARVVVKGFPDDQTSLDALKAGEVDMVASVSADFSHSTDPAVHLTPPLLYDGVGVMVPTAAGVSKLADLSGHKICFLAETEAETTLRAWFESHHLKFVPFPFQEEGEMEAAYVTGNCTGLAGDLTRLATTRAGLGSRSKDYTLLPEHISKDPLALASSASDAKFGKILDWTMYVLILAEEGGISSNNVDSIHNSNDPPARRLLGQSHEIGKPLGLDDGWAVRVIKAVGNYGQIFERDLGSGSPLKLPRGENNLWTEGGLIYGLPLK